MLDCPHQLGFQFGDAPLRQCLAFFGLATRMMGAVCALFHARLAGMAEYYFTKVTGIFARCITLVATEPSTILATVPMPRVPMTIMSH